VYFDSSSKLYIGGGIIDNVITSPLPTPSAEGTAMANVMLHLGFTRCFVMKESSRDITVPYAYLEGFRKRAVDSKVLELVDREIPPNVDDIKRALIDIKMSGK